MAPPPPPGLQDEDLPPPPQPLISLLLDLLKRILRFIQLRLNPSSSHNNTIPVTTQNSITRIRCYNSPFQLYRYYNNYYHHHQPALWNYRTPKAPFPCFDIEIQTSNQHQPRRESLPSSSSSSSSISQQGKTFISLTYQVAAALALSSSLGRENFFASIAKVNVVIAFAASFSGMSLRNVYPRTSALLENIGSLFAAVGFFATTEMFLPGNLMWVGWLACALSLLAFSLSFIN